MTDSSLLETTAEIAIAVVALVSIFLALVSRESRLPQYDAFSIKQIVGASGASVIYSVIPLLLHSLGVPEPMVWRVASFLALCIGAAIIAVVYPTWRRVPNEERRAISIAQIVLNNTLGAIWFFCLIANIFSWPWAPSGGVYLLAIWTNIVTCGLTFSVHVFDRVLER